MERLREDEDGGNEKELWRRMERCGMEVMECVEGMCGHGGDYPVYWRPLVRREDLNTVLCLSHRTCTGGTDLLNL